jgi:hypothetical protein
MGTEIGMNVYKDVASVWAVIPLGLPAPILSSVPSLLYCINKQARYFQMEINCLIDAYLQPSF